jgi:hypothetical protein
MPERWGAVRKVAVKMRVETRLWALLRRLAACGLLTAALFSFPLAATAQPDPYAPKWHPWVEFGGLGADDDDSRALGELWMPLLQGPSALFFFDGKFQFFEEDVREINAALGLRKMTASGWNLGAWFSGDLRETSNDNSFWQVAGGLEALSVKWDLRVNGYLPVTDPQASPSTAEIVLERNTIFMIGGEEVALHGFDGEVGYMLFGSPETKPGRRHELRVYGGGFWFNESDAIGEVAGPSARFEWRIDDLIPDWGGSRLTFDAGWSHDEVRGDLWQVGGRLRIPLGGTKTYALLSPQARRMQERIERDDDIIVVKSGPEKVFDTLTGVRFDRVAYVNPSITEVSAEAGDNSLLIVNGTVSGPQELQGNQTLQGGGSTIKVTGLKSGVTKPFTAPGAPATLVDPGVAPNLTLLGSNTHVAGLDIHGVPSQFLLVPPFFIPGNAAGISAPGPLDNIVIEQTSIADTGFAGISFGANNSNLRIFDTAITNGGSLGGIFFGIDNRDVTISDVRIADMFGSGIFLGAGARHVSISDSAISGITAGSGIGLGDADDVDISNVTISDIANVGILGSGNSNNVKISNSTITDTGSDGIRFGANNNNVTIADTTVANTGLSGIGVNLNGISFGSGNSNVLIIDTTVTNAARDGIHFENDNQDVTIAGSTIANAGGDGIFINANNAIALNNSILAGTFGGNGININGAGNTFSGADNTAAGATFGGQFCNVVIGPQTGSFAFVDDGSGNPATCPP